MLKALEIENFKSFGTRNRIEFAPITLIFGENSAGKSSILQCLYLLKQSKEMGEQGTVLLPRVEGGFVDLGSYRDLIFDHDLDRDLCIRIDAEEPSRERGRRPKGRTEGDTSSRIYGLEFRFQRRSEEKETELEHIDLINPGKGRLARFQKVALSAEEGKRLSRTHPFYWGIKRPSPKMKPKAMKCSWITSNEDHWEEALSRFKQQRPRILAALEKFMKKRGKEASDQELRRLLDLNEDDEAGGCRTDLAALLSETINFYEAEPSVERFIERMSRRELESRLYLDGFLPIPMYPGLLTVLPELMMMSRFGSSRFFVEGISIGVAGMTLEAGFCVRDALQSLFPMGPYRRPPERWYIYTGTNPEDVGYRGHFLPDLLFRRPELVHTTNGWLDRLNVGYHIEVRQVGQTTRDLFEVRLVDKSRKTPVDVALTDVGFGISQLLPFVVQSLVSEDTTITIEQPEVHVHPRLQADLGDLLAQAVRKPRANQFIIETHSEHLVLRVQKLVRTHQLKPEDVSVIYVSRTPEGSLARRLNLDNEGDFTDDWPGGFFPERTRELVD